MAEQTANSKLIILDPSLKDFGGHYYEYDVAVAAAALRRAKHTKIYAHKSCHALAIPGSEIRPWFSTEWSAAGGLAKDSARYILGKLPALLQIPLGKLGRLVWNLGKSLRRRPIARGHTTISTTAAKFGQEVAEALHHAGLSKDDIIFVPTIRTSELYALWKIVQRTPELQSVQFQIVLRRDADEMDLPEYGAPGISTVFEELHAAPEGKGFHFYCDTPQLCEDYASMSCHRLEFQLIPIPYPHANPNPLSLEKWSAGAAIKCVYLGSARMEKGFHLLVAAEKYLRNKFEGELLWRLQAPSGGLEEPEVIAARRQLSSVRDGSVELVERSLDLPEFQSLLLSADIVLLPYLHEFYRSRSSGVLIQVLAAGKPVVVPAGTWLSSQTNGVGAVEFTEISGFPDAVLQALRQLPKLSQEARDRAPAFAALHNADELVKMLVQTHSEPD